MIFCIVGRTSSGKDTLARKLSQTLNIPIVVSYTTRPMRKGEENGREHWFVDKIAYKHYKCNDFIVAETKIGDYYYWTIEQQFREYDNCIYVIDPKGLEILKSKMRNENVFVIYVDVDEETRRERGMMRGDDMSVWEMRNEDERREFEEWEKETEGEMFGEFGGWDMRIKDEERI